MVICNDSCMIVVGLLWDRLNYKMLPLFFHLNWRFSRLYISPQAMLGQSMMIVDAIYISHFCFIFIASTIWKCIFPHFYWFKHRNNWRKYLVIISMLIIWICDGKISLFRQGFVKIRRFSAPSDVELVIWSNWRKENKQPKSQIKSDI